MAGRLRIFLYREDAIVSQFLEQLEGGLYDEENIHTQTASSGSLGGVSLLDRSPPKRPETDRLEQIPSSTSGKLVRLGCTAIPHSRNRIRGHSIAGCA